MDENSPDSFDSFDSFDATTIVPSRKRRPQRTILAPVTNDKDDEEPKSRKRKIDNQLIDKRRSPALHIHIGERTDTFSEILTSKIVDLQVHSNSLDEGQRVLRCTNEANETSHVYLQDQWVETPIFVGNTIRLFDAKLWNENDWLIDAEQGLIVVEPDTLISATSVAQALFCARKTVLNERFRGGGGTNKAMLMGSIIHELFQLALLLKCPVTSEWVLTTWRSLIEKNLSYLVALTSLNFTPAHFESELQPYLDVICDWINDKIGERKPLPSGFVFNALVDTEENIWVPILGLKGKLDATLKVQDSQGKTHLEPLELKTGKSAHSIEHNVQVLLYCMMLSIREKKPMYPGSLVYLKDGVSRSVELRTNHQYSVVQFLRTVAELFIANIQHPRAGVYDLHETEDGSCQSTT